MDSKFDKEDQGFTDVPKYKGVIWKDGNSSSTNINDIPPINADNLNKSENALRAFFGEESSDGYLQNVINNQKSINSELHNKDNTLETNITTHINSNLSYDYEQKEPINTPHGITKSTIGLGNVDNYSYDEIHTKLNAGVVADSNKNYPQSDLIYNSFVNPLLNLNKKDEEGNSINAHQTIVVNTTGNSPVYEIKNIDLTINDETSHESTNNTNSTLTKVSYSVEKGQFDFVYKPIEIVTDQISNIRMLEHTTTNSVGGTITSISYDETSGNFVVTSEDINIVTDQISNIQKLCHTTGSNSKTITDITYEDGKFKVSSEDINITEDQVKGLPENLEGINTDIKEINNSVTAIETDIVQIKADLGALKGTEQYFDLNCGSSTELVD